MQWLVTHYSCWRYLSNSSILVNLLCTLSHSPTASIKTHLIWSSCYRRFFLLCSKLAAFQLSPSSFSWRISHAKFLLHPRAPPLGGPSPSLYVSIWEQGVEYRSEDLTDSLKSHVPYTISVEISLVCTFPPHSDFPLGCAELTDSLGSRFSFFGYLK